MPDSSTTSSVTFDNWQTSARVRIPTAVDPPPCAPSQEGSLMVVNRPSMRCTAISFSCWRATSV